MITVPLRLVQTVVIARYRGRPEVTVERRGAIEDGWAVCWMGYCLLEDGSWDFERQSSSRTDAFLARSRFPFEDAMRRGYEAIPCVIENHGPAGQAIEVVR